MCVVCDHIHKAHVNAVAWSIVLCGRTCIICAKGEAISQRTRRHMYRHTHIHTHKTAHQLTTHDCVYAHRAHNRFCSIVDRRALFTSNSRARSRDRTHAAEPYADANRVHMLARSYAIAPRRMTRRPSHAHRCALCLCYCSAMCAYVRLRGMR